MIAVILPTYNEAGNIRLLVEKLKPILPASSLIIIVDDSSKDGTAQIAEALSKQSNIRLISRPRKNGLGTAIKDGMRYALEQNIRFILTMDADLSHNPLAIVDMIKSAQSNSESVIVGSRYIEKGKNRNSIYRVLVSKISNFLISWLLEIKCIDTTSGFRMYPASILRTVNLDDLQSKGYGFQWEILYLLNKQKISFHEIPIDFTKRHLGKSKFNLKEIIASITTLSSYVGKK